MNLKGHTPGEEMLRQSEERYRLLFASNPHPVWVYERETLSILDASQSALKNYGYSREEFLSLTIKDLHPPEDIPALLKRVARLSADTKGAGVWRHRKKNGILTDVEITSHPIVYSGREARLVVATDITQRKQAEEELRQSEERFRLMVSGVKDYAIYMLDPEGQVISWNAGAERIKGYRAEEIIGQRFSRFYPAEDVARAKPGYELKAAVEQERLVDEGWRVRKNGSRFWANVVITALRHETGQLRGFGKVTRDMTERKQFEDTLQASEERFRSLAETANDAIVSADRQGNIVYFNRAAERIFDYFSKEIIGQPLTLLMPERFRNLHRQGLERFLRTGETRVIGRTVELVGRRRDGSEFPLELSLSSCKTRDGIFFTGILSDITERKLADQEILLRTGQLEAANEELDAFSYSVSHDLRAPLRSIHGFSQALLEDCADGLDDRGKDHLHRIRAATQRMGLLIDDLLNLARVTRAEIHPGRLDISALARSIAAELQKTEPERRMEFRIEDGLETTADARLLRLVLENLLGNAWKFTSKHASARVAFGKTHANGASAYFVRDDGAGFDPAYADKLFGAFQRLHAVTDFPGTRVGLATVQRIIHRHGGRVWAESAVERVRLSISHWRKRRLEGATSWKTNSYFSWKTILMMKRLPYAH
jgi:PAS domain S-box-containing protein